MRLSRGHPWKRCRTWRLQPLPPLSCWRCRNQGSSASPASRAAATDLHEASSAKAVAAQSSKYPQVVLAMLTANVAAAPLEVAAVGAPSATSAANGASVAVAADRQLTTKAADGDSNPAAAGEGAKSPALAGDAVPAEGADALEDAEVPGVIGTPALWVGAAGVPTTRIGTCPPSDPRPPLLGMPLSARTGRYHDRMARESGQITLCVSGVGLNADMGFDAKALAEAARTVVELMPFNYNPRLHT